MSENSKYREMFVQEALEHIENMNQHLLRFEGEPDVHEHVDVLFRSAHTLKGMAATMGYEQIREICKSIEEIFDKLRKGDESITKDLNSVILFGVDILKQLILDETKKIDLCEFLNYVANPSTLQKKYDAFTVSDMSSQTLRVKMHDLDILVNLVGEMMLSKMKLEKIMSDLHHDEYRDTFMVLSQLMSDLQHHAMHMRLVPIGYVFNRFSRMVRDISTSLGKNVRLETNDAGIEIDRAILDAVSDPLLHMIRNAIDHGIETPFERRMHGKSEMGTICLDASRINDRIQIRISDDGKGIDLDAIKLKALEKGIISQDRLMLMSEEEVVGLIGTPGLSTAPSVTDISGRGVGMDVVMTQVKNVGGRVKILTEKGKGTSIILSIPTSLAIIDGLLVGISDQKYVLPLSDVSTTMTIDRNDIQNVHGQEMIIIQDVSVPIIRTDVLFGIDSKNSNEKIPLVIVKKDGKSFGLVVDYIENEQEVVLKRLGGLLNCTGLFSDAAILSDGKIALILEPSMVI
jgi:two-component system chemotaxis sensor kinase CheA